MRKVMSFLLIMAFVIPFFSPHIKAEVTETKTLMVIPLDDRPVNLYVPKQISEASGIKVMFPPRELLGRFTTPGNTKEIAQWMKENAEKADGFVVSASMLAYGGLVASRTAVKSADEAKETMSVIKEVHQKYPNKPIYVYDTIQRLAVTATDAESAKYYDLIREWAILYDRVHNFGYEEGRARLEFLESTIPAPVLEEYKVARKRNHEINQELISWVKEGTINYLILAQDDAAPYGVHRMEREELLQQVQTDGVEDRVSLFPGTDEVGAVLISRYAANVYHVHPSIYVTYSGIPGSEWIAPFEDTTFDVNVEKHILAAGGTVTNNEQKADIHLLVNTPASNGRRHSEDIDKLVSITKSDLAKKRNVIIGDVLYVNKADRELVTKLRDNVSLPSLLSYSGWNTAGNAIGLALGHGIARYTFLNHPFGFGEPLFEKAAQANYEYLLFRFAKDDGYKNTVYPKAISYIKSLGADANNLGSNYETVNSYVEKELTIETQEWYKAFDNKTVVIGKRGQHTFTKHIKGLQSVHVQLPWPRVFESELEPVLTLE
jgi:hypothetical protein